jgi:hypothetical protein
MKHKYGISCFLIGFVTRTIQGYYCKIVLKVTNENKLYNGEVKSNDSWKLVPIHAITVLKNSKDLNESLIKSNPSPNILTQDVGTGNTFWSRLIKLGPQSPALHITYIADFNSIGVRVLRWVCRQNKVTTNNTGCSRVLKLCMGS